MICFQNISFLLLPLFLSSIAILYCQLSLLNDVFGSSPPVVRQEIRDGIHDVITIDRCNSTMINLTESDTIQSDEIFDLFNSLDIERVSYSSDGKILNATMWLSGLDNNFLPPGGYFPLNFGIFVDVNPNPAVGIGGVDFHKEVANFHPSDLPTNNETSNLWIENIHEALSDGPHRYLNASEKNYNYSQVFQYQTEKVGVVYHLPLSLDLSTVGFPDKYKIMFNILSSVDRCVGVTDLTSWIDVPPSIYTISTSPSPLELRPGIARDIGVVLKSNIGIPQKVADFTNLENDSGIQVIPAEGKLNKSAFSVEPVSFNVRVPGDAQTGEYTIPILATISTGSTIPSEFIGVTRYNISIPTESFITAVTNLTVEVLEPLNPSEIFKDFWDVYGDLIGLIGGGFAAGFSALVFERIIKKREGKRHQKTLDKY